MGVPLACRPIHPSHVPLIVSRRTFATFLPLLDFHRHDRNGSGAVISGHAKSWQMNKNGAYQPLNRPTARKRAPRSNPISSSSSFGSPYSDSQRPPTARPIPKLNDSSPEGFQRWLRSDEAAEHSRSASLASASGREKEEKPYRIPTIDDIRPVQGGRVREISRPTAVLSSLQELDGPVKESPQPRRFDFRPSPYQAVDSWRALQLPMSLRAALQRSFPYIVKPTPFQADLLQAITTGRDVVTRQGTGSGKSLALLLALLARKPPDYWPNPAPPLSLLLLPSSTLVEQLHSWANSLMPADSKNPLTLPIYIPSATSSISFESLVASLLEPPSKERPHPTLILATPQALLRALSDPRIPYSRNPTLSLDKVRTIAIDEADTTLNITSSYLANLEKDIARKKKNPNTPSRVHPSPGLLLMRKIFEFQAQRKELRGERFKFKPQVVMASASLNEEVKEVAERKERWIYGPDARIEIVPRTGAAETDLDGVKGMKRHLNTSDATLPADLSSSTSDKLSFPPPPTAPKVTHHVISVSLAGSIQNHTTPPPADETIPLHLQGGDPSSSGHQLVSRRSMDAFAQLYHALDPRPHRSLLVLPNGGSVPKIVAELAELEIKAEEVISANSRERASKGGGISTTGKALGLSAFKRTVDEPLVYLVDQTAVRGLDIPALSHVFVFSNALRDPDDYLHISGRVGRLSSPSATTSSSNTVFTIVDLPFLEPPSSSNLNKVRIRHEKAHRDGKITDEQRIKLIAKAERMFEEMTRAFEHGDLVDVELSRIEGMFDDLRRIHGGEKSEEGRVWEVAKCDLVD